MNAPAIRDKETITRFGLFIWMIKCQIGIGILSLPSDIYSSSDGDSWISVLIAGCAVQLLLIVYWKLYSRMPNRILSGMTIELFGSVVGRALNLLYYAYFLLIAGYAIAMFTRLVHTWLLSETPEPVISALIVITFVYLAVQTTGAIERFFMLASVLLVLILLFSLAAWSNDMHLSYILPAGGSGVVGILEGSQGTFFSMIGFEVVLFLFARVRIKEDGKSRFLLTITAANVFVTLIYAYFVLLCLLSFSPRALKLIHEPVLFLFKGTTFQLVDRLDLIFLSAWIFSMTTIFVGYIYMAGRSLSPHSPTRRSHILISSSIVYAVGFMLSEVDHKETIARWIQWIFLVQIVCLPVLLLAATYWKQLAGKRRLS